MLPVANVANTQLVLGIGYWQQFHIGNIPRGRQAVRGGVFALRGRATGRLCVVIRGVVSDAASRLNNGVICDLPFNVVGLPKKMGSIIAHPSMICQSPPRGALYLDLLDGGELVGGDVVNLDQNVPRAGGERRWQSQQA